MHVRYYTCGITGYPYGVPVMRSCLQLLLASVLPESAVLNGCCFGVPTESVVGLVFPAFSAAGSFYPDSPIHPAQIYNSILGFGLFGYLMWLDREKRFEGYLFSVLLILEPMTRFTVDFFRYYEASMTLTSLDGISLSVNQGVSIIICGIGFLLLGRLRSQAQQRRAKKTGQRRQHVQSSVQKSS